MKAFVVDLMTHVGARVDVSERVVRVALPAEGVGAELAARLGRHELALVFDPTDLRGAREGAAHDVELVAPGSHVLRVLEEWISSRGARTYVVASGEQRLTRARVCPPLEPVRGVTVALEGLASATGHDVHVVYRLRYRSRERIDALEAVRVRLRPGREPEAVLAPPPDAGVAEWQVKPRTQPPPEVAERALELADELVARRAEEEARRLEEEARSGLAGDVSRLHGYYAAQVAELARGSRRERALAAIEELEDERALRLGELAQACAVRAEVEPLQVLTVEVPLQQGTLRVRRRRARTGKQAPQADDAGEARLRVAFDRSTGELSIEPCPACGTALAHVDLCDGGHAVHPGCAHPCVRCGRRSCAACGVANCGVCGATLCTACGVPCPGCGQVACAADRVTCAVCAAAGCRACTAACGRCGGAACREHALRAQEEGQPALCTACARPCPGCHAPVAQDDLRRCATCGRRFCAGCHPAGASACVLCAG